MREILVAVLIIDSIALIGLVLLQHGKGADAGATFGGGGGGSETLFGASGSATFLSRVTAALATIFFGVSMALAFYSAQRTHPSGLAGSVTSAPSAIEKPAPAKKATKAKEKPAKKTVKKKESSVPEVPK
jgi:preprotein translocase subunit SecG